MDDKSESFEARILNFSSPVVATRHGRITTIRFSLLNGLRVVTPPRVRYFRRKQIFEISNL
jgi:hypothetical protein